jgi:hypothetical protein
VAQIIPSGNSDPGYKWTFFRAGGFDQVRLESGADILNLDRLDQKLWSSLSCPVKGVEFDERTLAVIDKDGDGRIRAPEIIEAARWACSMLRDPDDLVKCSPVLPLASINDAAPEGRELLDCARHILANLGKPDSPEISIDDIADVAKLISLTRFNGDGIVPADAAEDEATRQVIADMMECLGSEPDRSGQPGISREKLEQFFTEAAAYSDWQKEAEAGGGEVMPCGEGTEAAAAAFSAVRDKIEDYFTRCRLAAFDERAAGAMNRREEEYAAIAGLSLSPSLEEVAAFPLARVEARKALPLETGLNPAWVAAMGQFSALAARPILGRDTAMTESDWEIIKNRFSAYYEWLSRKAGADVEKLGTARVREILNGGAKDAIAALIDRDTAMEAEFNNITQVERLVRYNRDLLTLLKNFVSFGDFYTRRKKAIFQAGTLYLDGRSCELCVRVNDIDQHATLAALSRIYLAYCKCTRNGGAETMTIAAAFTGGDSDFLMVGRNGIFYDRKGQDWDAVIVRVIENPISIRQAFWTPYKQMAKMIGRQINKLAAARDKAIMDKAAVRITDSTQKMAEGKPAAPAPRAQPFDAAKFAGIFAAIGLAVGFIGTAIVSVVTGFLKLAWWQMPLVIAGLMLIISTPSVVIAWLKLRQRTLGPILDANGWAVNARVRINITFGRSLTKLAALPEGAVRSLDDQYADKKRRWPKVLVLLALLGILLYFLNERGLIYKWASGLPGF